MPERFLRVKFPKTDNVKYNQTQTWQCFSFDNCDYWQPAQSISWGGLPFTLFASFYETRNCEAQGKFVFHSADGLTSGIKKFPSSSPQAIRSMMIGGDRNYTRHPVAIHHFCPAWYKSKEQSSIEAVHESSIDSTHDLEWKSDNGSVEDGGTSSNWYDALEEESTA